MRRFHRTKHPEDFVQYNLYKAKARRTLKLAREGFTKAFLSALSPRIPLDKLYNKINRFAGRVKRQAPIVLKNNDGVIVDPVEVANKL